MSKPGQSLLKSYFIRITGPDDTLEAGSNPDIRIEWIAVTPNSYLSATSPGCRARPANKMENKLESTIKTYYNNFKIRLPCIRFFPNGSQPEK